MKKNIAIIVFIISILLSCDTENKKPITPIDTTISKIEIIDFYGKRRCTTCKNIEANTKYTIESFFKQEVKSGLVELKFIDVEKDENYNIAEKFQATGTALFLNVIKNGVEKHIDLTEFAFKWGNEQVEYSIELENKIREQLKNIETDNGIK